MFKRLFMCGAAIGALLLSPIAVAEPVPINDDEGYARLARWETHLDQRIESGVRDGCLPTDRAWRIQKELDNIESRVLYAYFQSDHGIDGQTFHGFADRLRRMGAELGDRGWREESFSDEGYGAPPPPQGYGAPPPPPQASYYNPGGYENDCRDRGNTAIGTIFGALGGGLIGAAASHGNGAAIAGGVVLGGLVGNALSRDIDCEDHRYAFTVYQQAFDGDLDREYRWRHGDRYGTIVATREYRRNGLLCRDFHAVNYRGGQSFQRDGTVCRENDGNWHFE